MMPKPVINAMPWLSVILEPSVVAMLGAISDVSIMAIK
jgi:hypothetical protein